jgi:uncharacterized SAM-binding protein YcdF (DUF218 family)
VNPRVTETLVPADAIVVFPGGPEADERFERAIRLTEAGLAPVLFVATDVKQTDLEASICDGTDYEFETACRTTNPVNTFGNAVVTAEVAAQRGWKSVILVTSDDHIARSHMLLRRCFDGDIQTAVSVKTEGRERVRRTVYEWGAMVKAVFVDRC